MMMDKIHILIIEDDVDHAFLEEDMLTDELNCHVKVVRSKAELEREHIVKSDIVLLDFNLPDATGSEILTEIRRFSDIPVLIITGNDQLQTAVDTLKSGASDFLIKSPDNIRQLPKLVTNVIDKFKKTKRQQAMQKEQERIDLKVETLRQVLTTLAHYINNSTTTIYGYAQLCEQNPKDSLRCKKLSAVSIKETQKISFVLQELEEFVNTTEIKTTNYVNIPEAMFSIEENLKKKMETL